MIQRSIYVGYVQVTTRLFHNVKTDNGAVAPKPGHWGVLYPQHDPPALVPKPLPISQAYTKPQAQFNT